jgi:tRNA(His) guanylyltransferase
VADNTDLGNRMKRHELASFGLLPRRTYTIIRVDGRAFHSYLRDDEKPFDMDFIEAMQKTAAAMCREMAGTVLAYGQSDEISFLLTAFATPQAEP